MNIYPHSSNPSRGISWRFEKFAKIAETGIPLCVYVDSTGFDILNQFIDLFPNIRFMKLVSIQDTWIHQICDQFRDEIQLPKCRTPEKDTYEYMVLMHAKIEFVADAIRANPWGSKHYAWIDFNIAHIFRNEKGCQDYLREMATKPLTESFLTIPGCWSSWKKDNNIVDIIDHIHWRFCGGFFLGDKDSLMHFHDLYQEHFPQFIFLHKRMTWEVNFWAWLEATDPSWKPIWFLADHNDSILTIPENCHRICLASHAASYQIRTYDYPELDGFIPMSASIVGGEENNTYLLNTRYVNYRLADNGSYIFYHPEAIIITKNLCTILDASFHPIEHFEISNDICLPSFKCKFDGMEDIRIWQDAGSSTIKYMGTSINYSPIQRNRMVTGIYHTAKKRLVKSYVIQPPTDSWCEKNWTPVPSSDPDIPTRIIYKWGPMEVGHLEDGKLVIDATIHIPNPMFQRFRGSTYFRPSVQYPDYLIGLVHFSEHEWPRHYYHVLLLLDKVTLTPVKYSYSFSFCKQKSIEFCIGFIENHGYYHFWISQYDRDPAMVSVSVHDLPVDLIV